MKMWTIIAGVCVSLAVLMSGYYGYTQGAQIDMERQEEAIRQENVRLYGTPDGSVETATVEDEDGNRFYLLLVEGVDETLADYEHVEADGSTVFVKMVRFYPPEVGMLIQALETRATEYKIGVKDRLPIIKIRVDELGEICSDIGMDSLEALNNLGLIPD